MKTQEILTLGYGEQGYGDYVDGKFIEIFLTEEEEISKKKDFEEQQEINSHKVFGKKFNELTISQANDLFCKKYSS